MNDLKNIKVNDFIVFEGEKQKYEVQARNERFIICTKPFNLKKTVLYSIIDLDKQIRGCDNLVFGCGYETREECETALSLLKSGEAEVSHRNNVSLEVSKIIKGHLPKYVTLNGTALRLIGNNYYRDAGDWTVMCKYEDNVLLSKHSFKELNNVELVETDYDFWKKDNVIFG